MDVVPLVAKEVSTRYHRHHSTEPSSSNTAASAVTTDLTTLLTRLWLLGAKGTDEAGNVADTAENIETMVDEMTEFLLTCSTPNLATLLLQSQSYTLKSTLSNKRRTAEVKKEAVTMRLTSAILAKSNVSPDELLGDITLFILHAGDQLTSNVGAELEGLTVHKETAAVLCSVLPRNQVTAFMRQDSVEKQRQLEELRRIVSGIRLFNLEEGKTTGAGLQAVHALLEKPLDALEKQVTEELTRCERHLEQARVLLTAPTCPLNASDARRLREEYHHYLQVAHCLLTVRCMLANTAFRVHRQLLPKYDETLAELRTAFENHKNKAAASAAAAAADSSAEGATAEARTVPKRIVYPLFAELTSSYDWALRIAEEFTEMKSLVQLALNSSLSYETSLPTFTAEQTAGAQAATIRDHSALQQLVENTLELAKGKLGEYRVYYTRTPPHTVDPAVESLYPRSLFALRGFCPVRYAVTAERSAGTATTHVSGSGGLLIPGRLDGQDQADAATCPGFVVVEGGTGRGALHKPYYVAFHDEADLRTFAADPLRYLLPCLTRCNRVEPGVTLLMGLLERLPQELYITGSRVVEQIATTVSAVEGVKLDAVTQTDQIDAYKDHNYRWNEWDLRREALKLANLVDMRTHSTQTAASHFRRDNEVQVNPPKDSETQTAQDAAVQPPHVVQYLKGLRGTESSTIEQVQRTFQY